MADIRFQWDARVYVAKGIPLPGEFIVVLQGRGGILKIRAISGDQSVRPEDISLVSHSSSGDLDSIAASLGVPVVVMAEVVELEATIRFEYGGVQYEVPPETYMLGGRVVLPDGRVIEIQSWTETTPPIPKEIVLIVHGLTARAHIEALAQQYGAVIAVRIESPAVGAKPVEPMTPTQLYQRLLAKVEGDVAQLGQDLAHLDRAEREEWARIEFDDPTCQFENFAAIAARLQECIGELIHHGFNVYAAMARQALMDESADSSSPAQREDLFRRLEKCLRDVVRGEKRFRIGGEKGFFFWLTPTKDKGLHATIHQMADGDLVTSFVDLERELDAWAREMQLQFDASIRNLLVEVISRFLS